MCNSQALRRLQIVIRVIGDECSKTMIARRYWLHADICAVMMNRCHDRLLNAKLCRRQKLLEDKLQFEPDADGEHQICDVSWLRPIKDSGPLSNMCDLLCKILEECNSLGMPQARNKSPRELDLSPPPSVSGSSSSPFSTCVSPMNLGDHKRRRVGTITKTNAQCKGEAMDDSHDEV